jgi:hypothetical protein
VAHTLPTAIIIQKQDNNVIFVHFLRLYIVLCTYDRERPSGTSYISFFFTIPVSQGFPAKSPAVSITANCSFERLWAH